jgi:heme O synthase-like polyprenyltransferase
MPGRDDAVGTVSATKSIAWSVLLIAASLALTPLGVTSRLYALIAVVLGAPLLALGVAWARRPAPERALRLFLGTLVYLPVLLIAMVTFRR